MNGTPAFGEPRPAEGFRPLGRAWPLPHARVGPGGKPHPFLSLLGGTGVAGLLAATAPLTASNLTVL